MTAGGGSPTPGLVIAIDGLSGTGKSTLARELAAVLGVRCLNTGLYFRLAARLAVEEGLAVHEVAERLVATSEPLALYAAAEAHEDELRDPRLAAPLAELTRDPEVRGAVLVRERTDIAALGDAVVEGRDIGTVVAPWARLKLFLVATDAVRIARRREEGQRVLERDRANARRAVAPALPAEDAVVVDTSDVTVAALVRRVLDLLDALGVHT